MSWRFSQWFEGSSSKACAIICLSFSADTVVHAVNMRVGLQVSSVREWDGCSYSFSPHARQASLFLSRSDLIDWIIFGPHAGRTGKTENIAILNISGDSIKCSPSHNRSRLNAEHNERRSQQIQQDTRWCEPSAYPLPATTTNQYNNQSRGHPSPLHRLPRRFSKWEIFRFGNSGKNLPWKAATR